MVWQNVKTFEDGVDSLDAKTLNTPIEQLAARTEYLRRLVEAAAGNSNVAIASAELSRGEGDSSPLPALGQPVYRYNGNSYALAAAVVGDVSTSKWFWADHQAMAVGIVGSTPVGSTAMVVLNGYVSFGDGIAVEDVIVDANPTSGRYFLAQQAGKLTAAPVGPIIYVCDCEIRGGKIVSMLVNPQYRDTGESHVHRSFVLSGMSMGGYSMKGTRISATNIFPDNTTVGSTLPNKLVALVLGTWNGAQGVTYTLTVKSTIQPGTDASSSVWSDWSKYYIEWSSSDTADGSGTIGLSALTGADTHTAIATVGVHGLKVQIYRRTSGTVPKELIGDVWTLAMPVAARAWRNTDAGFALNLSAYPELASYIPPSPVNGAALVVGGVEVRGAAFGQDKQWEIVPADIITGGPWLLWYGCATVGDGITPTAPFLHDSTASVVAATPRSVILHVNRMRVGPTGFVTSLQAAPGSPLKVTSAQTGANAVQGALQVGLDIDFKSTSGGAEGSEVVKKIVGSTFVTGPVVEKIVAGPGLSANNQQGIVTLSASNAVYAGDFETIALKNAKQDLAGGVFPYTKLLRWASSGTNVDSGFTAKFRVPDHIPYNANGYYVVVSASVFGEAAPDRDRSAAFRLRSYMLADRACSDDAPASVDFDNSIDDVATEYAPTVYVPFKLGYAAFNPLLLHGFGKAAGAGPGDLVLADIANQRASDSALWLGTSSSVRMKVYPGYFVGISIERCGLPTGSTVNPYEGAIGFLSLRWNLVAAKEA